jgi:hypothetical protein
MRAEAGHVSRRSAISPCVPRGAEVARNVGAYALAHLGRNGRLIQQSQQAVARDQAAARQFAGKDRVLLAAGDILGDREIVRVQAQPLYDSGITLRQVHQPALHPLGNIAVVASTGSA